MFSPSHPSFQFLAHAAEKLGAGRPGVVIGQGRQRKLTHARGLFRLHRLAQVKHHGPLAEGVEARQRQNAKAVGERSGTNDRRFAPYTFAADVKAWQKAPERYWVNAPKDVADVLVGWIGPFH